MSTETITIIAAVDRYTPTATWWRVTIDGRHLCTCRLPFCDGARALIAEGRDPDATLVMQHDGSRTIALRARLGAAARLTVREDRGPPEFAGWKPHGLTR